MQDILWLYLELSEFIYTSKGYILYAPVILPGLLRPVFGIYYFHMYVIHILLH